MGKVSIDPSGQRTRADFGFSSALKPKCKPKSLPPR